MRVCYLRFMFSLTAVLFFSFQLTDDVKKEKEKEPEKAEQQPTTMLRKKGFEEEKRDSDDSDEVVNICIFIENRTKRMFSLLVNI